MTPFDWTTRKADRNAREHANVSFPLAQNALESGLGVPIEEQFVEGEWRTAVVAPSANGVLLFIVIAHRIGDEDEQSTSDEKVGTENEGWKKEDLTIRIISARKATAHERRLYLEASPPSGR